MDANDINAVTGAVPADLTDIPPPLPTTTKPKDVTEKVGMCIIFNWLKHEN